MSIIPKKPSRMVDGTEIIELHSKNGKLVGLQEKIGHATSWRLGREMMATEAWRQAPPNDLDRLNAEEVLKGGHQKYSPNVECVRSLSTICQGKVMHWWKFIWGMDSGFQCVKISEHEVRGYRTKVLPDGTHEEVKGKGAFFIIGTSYAHVILEMLKKWDNDFLIPGERSLARARWNQRQEEKELDDETKHLALVMNSMKDQPSK